MAGSLSSGAGLQQFAATLQQQLPSLLSDGGVQLATTLQQQLAYSTRMQLTVAAAVLCGAWLRLVVSKCPPSLWSMALVLPVVAFNCWVPLLFHYREELCTRCMWLLLLMWLGSYKAMGLCLGRGPLAGNWTLGQTCLLYIMPIYPSDGDTGGVKKGRLTDDHGTSTQALLSFLANTSLLAVLAYALTSFNMPMAVKYYIYGLALYGFITFLMDGPAALLISLMGLKVVPPFDKPWLSETLADFWSRRWNNTTSLMLRALVYDPIVEGTLIKQQQQQVGRVPMWLRLVGMTATFAVSGIMHEVVLCYLYHSGQYFPGYWFGFFLVQAPLLLAEGLLHKRLAASKLRVPRFLGITYTTLVVVGLASLLWYPPIDTYTDIAPAVVASINRNVGSLMVALRQQCSSWGLDPLMVELAAVWPASAV